MIEYLLQPFSNKQQKLRFEILISFGNLLLYGAYGVMLAVPVALMFNSDSFFPIIFIGAGVFVSLSGVVATNGLIYFIGRNRMGGAIYRFYPLHLVTTQIYLVLGFVLFVSGSNSLLNGSFFAEPSKISIWDLCVFACDQWFRGFAFDLFEAFGIHLNDLRVNKGCELLAAPADCVPSVSIFLYRIAADLLKFALIAFCWRWYFEPNTQQQDVDLFDR